MSQSPPRPTAPLSLVGSLGERLRAAGQALLPPCHAAIEGLEVSDSSWEEWETLCRQAEQHRHAEAVDAMLSARERRREAAMPAWARAPGRSRS